MSTQPLQEVVAVNVRPQQTQPQAKPPSIQRHLTVEGPVAWALTGSLLLHVVLAIFLITTSLLERSESITTQPRDPSDHYVEVLAVLPVPEQQEKIDEPLDVIEPEEPKANIKPEPVPEPPKPALKPRKTPRKKISKARPQPKQVQEDRVVLPPSSTGDANIPAAPAAAESNGAPTAATSKGEPRAAKTAKTELLTTRSTPQKVSPGPDTGALTKGYLRELNGLVKAGTHYPRQARRAGLEGKVIVKVVLDARGKVLSVEIYKSSGHSVLDKAALKTIEAFDRFPAPPSELDWDERKVLIPVRFRLN